MTQSVPPPAYTGLPPMGGGVAAAQITLAAVAPPSPSDRRRPALECIDFNPKKRPPTAQNIIDRLHLTESIPAAGGQIAEAASSTSGVAVNESKGKGNIDDPSVFRSGAHPLANQTVVVPRAASISPQRATHHAMGVPPPKQTVGMPRAAPTSPRRATLHAMGESETPPMQTVVMPRPLGSAPAQQPRPFYGLVETRPPLPANLGRRSTASMYDMVEPMLYLYVTVVKARDLPTMEITGSLGRYVEVKVGNIKGVTKYLEKNAKPLWQQTFAFSRQHIQSSQLEIIVKDKDVLRDNYVGRVVFDMSNVPVRLLPDSPLAPLWYHLSDSHGNKLRHGGHGLGEIMLAVWLGTQTDEAFPEAWHSEAHSLSREELTNTRSKVYYSPKLVYLRVIVIAAQDLIASNKGRPLAETIAKIQMGNQIRRTRPRGGTTNPLWNEEFMFVASEPFEDPEPLVVTVEERVSAGRDVPISRVTIQGLHVHRNGLARSVPSKWFSMSPEMAVEEAATFMSKIQLKMSLETAYHVLDESSHYCSDLQPAAKDLRRAPIGILEVGVLSARGLTGMKNPYCVAKYGDKWVRTRTLLATAEPQWNEQYTWDVFDLTTVITVAVFDNANLHHGAGAYKDQRIGKVRVRLATLESDRVYTYYYPLIALSPLGLKKTGELHLAVRFTCTAWANMQAHYFHPLFPKKHYTDPISVLQMDYLRLQAMQLVTAQLARADPPLRREVVEYMLDVDSKMFSLRRSKANLHRIASLFSGVAAVAKLFDGICRWKNPLATMLVHVMFLHLVCYPELILPMVFLCMIMIGAWNYPWRPLKPPYTDTVLSQVEEFDTFLPPNIDSVLWYTDQSLSDELDEEFDTSPTSRPDDVVQMRYDRLRSTAGRVQTVIGDLVRQGERAQSLLRWHDPRVTPIFITLSLLAAVVLYLTPFQVVALVMGIYFLRPPWLRSRSNLLFNLYTRLPSKDDVML
ncbi:hypothetical protein ACQ4PT_055563 [Festuca glaucescens]